MSKLSLEEKVDQQIEKESTLKLFSGIWGGTPRRWYNKGYRALEDLEDLELNKMQLVGIMYYSSLNQEMDDDEVHRLFEQIKDVVQGINPKFIVLNKGVSENMLTIEIRKGTIEDLLYALINKGALSEIVKRKANNFYAISSAGNDSESQRKVHLKFISR